MRINHPAKRFEAPKVRITSSLGISWHGGLNHQAVIGLMVTDCCGAVFFCPSFAARPFLISVRLAGRADRGRECRENFNMV